MTMWRTTFGAVVLAVAVAHRRPVGVERRLLGRALHVDDRLEQLVLDADRRGGAAGLLRLLGGDERDRLAVVADAVDGEHRLVGELEPVRLLRRARPSCVSTAWTPGIAQRLRRCRARRCWRARAGCGPCTPQSIPAAFRSLE